MTASTMFFRLSRRIGYAAVAILLSAEIVTAEMTPAPYTGQESRAIKALSDRETADLLAGHGMGYALAAELNGYPGPLHVLDLADRLGLTAEQRTRVDAAFRAMQSQAKAIGAEIVAGEQKLDSAFAAATIDPTSLAAQTEALGQLYARARAIHLAAHLEMKALLTPQQIATYDQLRGYSATSIATPATPHNHGHN